jgi:peptidoglycan pentaglycine glycine transferase (the first glycine)
MDVSLNMHDHDDFLEQFPLGSFLQSRFWQRFLTLQGKKSWQLSVYKNNRLVANCLLYTNKLILDKSYLYAPKGPFILPTLSQDERKEALELILSQIRDITIATRRREEIFCRLEPNINPSFFSSMPVSKVRSIQPQTTTYLELNQDPNSLIKNFREKTRYNVRLAQKKGVKVHWSPNKKGLKIFISLLHKSYLRNKIKTHPRKYYNLLLKAGEESNNICINWAEYKNKAIAANFYILQYPTMTYLHGGFNYRYRRLMAPYLLQWEAMKFAIEQQIKYYDFFGFTPTDGSKPSLAGISKFKRGFDGKIAESPGCFDFIYNPAWYNLYTKARKIRRLI